MFFLLFLTTVFSNQFSVLTDSHSPGSTTYTCMLNKNGGIAADLTVSVLDSQDDSTSIFPSFEGMAPVNDAYFSIYLLCIITNVTVFAAPYCLILAIAGKTVYKTSS